ERLASASAHAIDGRQRTLVPAPRIAHGENDLRLGVGGDELSPEIGARPVDDGPIAGEEWPPVDRLPDLFTPDGLVPEGEPLRMLDVLQHVIAGTEAKPHQRLA